MEKTTWGELEPDEEDAEESESEAESDEDEDNEEPDHATTADGLQTPSGLATPSGMASVVSTIAGGLETPDFLELRKNPPRSGTETPAPMNKTLYQVLPERQTSVRGLMGSDRGYDVSAATANAAIPVLGEERGTKRKAGGVDISLDAAELEGMSEEELRRKYDANYKGTVNVPGSGPREDLSDMMAREMAKKRAKVDKDNERRRERGKEYKF
jgi:splicing factor 3B subunit 2